MNQPPFFVAHSNHMKKKRRCKWQNVNTKILKVNLCKGDQTSVRVGQRLRRGLGRRLALCPRSRHVSLLRITCVTCHVSRVTWPVHRVNVCMQVPHSGARHRGPRSSPGTAAPGIRRWQTCARHASRCLTMLYNTSDKCLFLAMCNFLSYIGLFDFHIVGPS